MFEFNKIIYSEGVSVPGGHFEIEFFLKLRLRRVTCTNFLDQTLALTLRCILFDSLSLPSAH